MIREDGLPFEESILARFNEYAGVVAELFFANLPRDIIEELYEEHKDSRAKYDALVAHHAGKPAKFVILEGEDDLYERVNNDVGYMDPAEAAEGTIRSWSDDSIAEAMEEGRMVRNYIHRSATLEDAMREAKIAFRRELDEI